MGRWAGASLCLTPSLSLSAPGPLLKVSPRDPQGCRPSVHLGRGPECPCARRAICPNAVGSASRERGAASRWGLRGLWDPRAEITVQARAPFFSRCLSRPPAAWALGPITPRSPGPTAPCAPTCRGRQVPGRLPLVHGDTEGEDNPHPHRPGAQRLMASSSTASGGFPGSRRGGGAYALPLPHWLCSGQEAQCGGRPTGGKVIDSQPRGGVSPLGLGLSLQGQPCGLKARDRDPDGLTLVCNLHIPSWGCDQRGFGGTTLSPPQTPQDEPLFSSEDVR